MYKVGDYAFVNNIGELLDRSMWVKDGKICAIGLGIFHDATNINYPHAFKICESPDNYSCSDWYPCLNRDMIKAVDNSIDGHKRDIESLRKLRKTLKEKA